MKTPYLTKEKFESLSNTTIDEKEFQDLLLLAEQKINKISFNRIVGIGFENLTDFQKEKVEKAIVYQIQYFQINGIEESNNLSSYSVLDISVNVDKNNQTEAEKLNMSSFAYDCMQETGLCSRNFRWH